jgi:hypothetical protein
MESGDAGEPGRLDELQVSYIPMPSGGKAGKKRHYIPAAEVARFTFDKTKPEPRDRPVHVLRHAGGKPFPAAAKKVAYENRLYGYGTAFDSDGFFHEAEKFAQYPVENIIRSMVDGHAGSYRVQDWAKVAWYITTLFMRGPDLERRVKATMAQVPATNNVPLVFLYEWGCLKLSTAVLRAQWHFVANLDLDFILPDRGVAGVPYKDLMAFGYFIPLRPGLAVTLAPTPYPKPVKWHPDAGWLIDIPTDAPPPGAGFGRHMNRVSWLASKSECYGRSEQSLLDARADASTSSELERMVAQGYESAFYLGLDRDRDVAGQEILRSLAFYGIPTPGDDDPHEYLM